MNDGGRWTLYYDGESKDGNTYESLAELVNDNYRLQILYPDMPKAAAFSTTKTTVTSNIPLTTLGEETNEVRDEIP